MINKFFLKLTANRLSNLLPSLIGTSQSGFVVGRDIADNILFAQEMVHEIDHKTCTQRLLNLLGSIIL